jgi:hypothetical protein
MYFSLEITCNNEIRRFWLRQNDGLLQICVESCASARRRAEKIYVRVK